MARDLYQEVTDRIIKALEEGVAPWVKPWKVVGGDSSMPRNGATKRPYSGVNVLLCWMSGYASNDWYTFNQAKKLGANVRKGEKGTMLVFFKQIVIEDKVTEEKKRIPLLRHFVVFNREQIEGLPDEQVVDDNEAPNDPPTLVQQIIEEHNIRIQHKGNTACYIPSFDIISMPKVSAFRDLGAYCATLLHEMAHWTGAESRLARETIINGGTFGSGDYAEEELVAEIASAFLCASLGVEGTLQHPSYIASWIKRLKDDKRAIFRASSAARTAADFLLGGSAVEEEEEEEAAVA